MIKDKSAPLWDVNLLRFVFYLQLFAFQEVGVISLDAFQRTPRDAAERWTEARVFIYFNACGNVVRQDCGNALNLN